MLCSCPARLPNGPPTERSHINRVRGNLLARFGYQLPQVGPLVGKEVYLHRRFLHNLGEEGAAGPTTRRPSSWSLPQNEHLDFSTTRRPSVRLTTRRNSTERLEVASDIVPDANGPAPYPGGEWGEDGAGPFALLIGRSTPVAFVQPAIGSDPVRSTKRPRPDCAGRGRLAGWSHAAQGGGTPAGPVHRHPGLGENPACHW